MNRTLIIGGAGFIGSRYVRDFGAGDVTVFDNLSPIVHNRASIAEFIASGVDFIPGDVTQPEDVAALFERGVPENLLLLAAETGTGRSLHNCALNTRVNALGTALVLDALSRAGTFPRRIVLTSSRAVYGEGPYRDGTGRTVYPDQREETDLKAGRFEFDGLAPQAMAAAAHLPNPSNIYGTTKLAQESLVRNWARSFGVSSYVLRLQNVYGAGQSLTNPYTGVLIHFLRNLRKAEPVLIYEQGGITRDFVHVGDIAQAIDLAFSGSAAPGVYDIGSGERVALETVAGEICTLTGGPAPAFCDRYRLGDVRHAAADITAAHKALGFEPRVPLADGLSELNDFFAAHPDV
ncbi:MAG: NAD-dependent epimerase/dehydratase family protein [Pseudomonadota bacterium]